MLTLTYAVTAKPMASGATRRGSANDAALLERADAAKALRCRQLDSRGEVDVGDPAFVLDDVENLVVDGVEAGGHHKIRG
jgi:hypothetical protein